MTKISNLKKLLSQSIIATTILSAPSAYAISNTAIDNCIYNGITNLGITETTCTGGDGESSYKAGGAGINATNSTLHFISGSTLINKPNNALALLRSSYLDSNSDSNLTIGSVSTTTPRIVITGGTGGASGAGGAGINATNSTLTFNVAAFIHGGSGGSGTFSFAGGDGGHGIIANDSTLTFNEAALILGGTGGTGGTGFFNITGVNGHEGHGIVANNSILIFKNRVGFSKDYLGDYSANDGNNGIYLNNSKLVFHSYTTTSSTNPKVNISDNPNVYISDLILNNSTLEFQLGTQSMEFRGNVSSIANSQIIINTTYDGSRLGALIIQEGTFDALTNIDNVTIRLTEDSNAQSIPAIGQLNKFKLLVGDGGAISFSSENLTLNAIQKADHEDIVDWKFNNGTLEQTIKPEFKDGVVINVALDAGFEEGGSQTAGLVFLGSATINQPIGANVPPKSIAFVANDHANIVHLNSDLTAEDLRFGKATYKPANNVTMTSTSSSTTHYNNPVFELGTNTFILAGSVVHDDAAGDIMINTTYDSNDTSGHIAMTKSGDSIDFTNSSGLIVNITDALGTAQPTAGETRSFDLFVENGGALTLKGSDDTTINAFTAANEENKFVDWAFDSKTGILSETLKPNALDTLNDIVDNENLDNLTPETQTEILNIAANQGGATASDAIERLTNSDAVAIASAPVTLAIQDATQVVSNRAEKISQPLQFITPIAVSSSDSRISGVAAGDAVAKYGAWVSPFCGISSQNSRGGQPGYKSSYYGGVVGFDSLINDETALGLALSYIKTDIKHKDKNAGDKTKADSFIVSAYGTYEITKEWFVQSVATFGHSKIKNREIRTEFGAANIAAADYNATSWGAEILTGYNQKIRDNVMFTPLFGLEFNRANGINYKETGTNTQNLAINRGSTNQLEAILGARISAVHAMDIYQKYVTFLPEIHGNARYGLLNNKLDIDIRQDGVSGPSLVPRTAKQARMVYNVGGSITAKYNNQWEYAIGYDARLADKYIAHQGTLKLRLNF